MPPKRKAAVKLSGLVGSDDEDIMQVTSGTEPSNEPPATKRRGRSRVEVQHEDETETNPAKPATTRTKKQKPAVKSTEAPTEKKPTRRGPTRGSTRAAQDAETAAHAVDEEDMDPEHDDALDQENEEPPVHKNTKTQPVKAVKPKTTASTARGRGRGRAASVQLQTDGEFEFTPGGARHVDAVDPHGQVASRKEPEVEDSQLREEVAAELVDETPVHKRNTISPVKTARSRLSMLRNPQDFSPRKRKLGGTESEQSGDPELRRRLGELTKKHDALESRYRNLREIGIVEATANMEKLRKHSEAVATASNELVAQLKAELEAQRKLANQSRGLQKQLSDRDAEMVRLKSDASEARAQLASAQSEVKALQTKLAAARNTAASLEVAAAKVPGSAIKGGSNRANTAANAEAAQASQIAQLKEDLYSDLSGLIIRDIKNRDAEHVYDCLQTGINGTLHFHLVVPKNSTDYDKAEFQYLPLLDANRDRDLVNLLPDFLTVDITFVRGQAAKFYTRVIDALTKRRSLPAQ
ncbi:Monopolin complex subunit Csm1/Pcs1 [Penicillium sp. DV-2018c]|nr:Monopolin complex subunit Csm1/Pcs1 [Penicillium sp. DV-2018c]KAJ5571859.1 Monopolin complex subunit Csm1/Pcs1 [Penicillium sp. DV-2018c]